ncbi:hypothetical protein STCU_12232 [Strigomonas culicis]|uniref:Uncharacterized protein n=1 Tax=Strigomonas culicis TaxID=28005 RepID=S9TFV7_9TRYP|nr:hypothetical protein STCU_12232 [Strigomonas culicis]|eukprot:EPY15218.1 hypothetical protein STCU_12232 [Strigomonas culicis]
MRVVVIHEAHAGGSWHDALVADEDVQGDHEPLQPPQHVEVVFVGRAHQRLRRLELQERLAVPVRRLPAEVLLAQLVQLIHAGLRFLGAPLLLFDDTKRPREALAAPMRPMARAAVPPLAVGEGVEWLVGHARGDVGAAAFAAMRSRSASEGKRTL